MFRNLPNSTLLAAAGGAMLSFAAPAPAAIDSPPGGARDHRHHPARVRDGLEAQRALTPVR